MGWQDAPVVGASPPPAASWQSAPLVGAAPPAAEHPWYSPLTDAMKAEAQQTMDFDAGVLKGVGNTVTGLASAVHAIPGVSGVVDRALGQPGVSDASLEASRAAMQPTSPMQSVGRGLEQVGEFALVPGPAKVTGAMRAAEAATSGLAAAGLTKAQGGTTEQAAAAGVLGGLPVASAVEAAGRYAGELAPKFIRSAIKPTVSAMKRVAGASVEGVEAKAAQLVDFILEHKLTTADKARDIIRSAEQELQRVLAVKNAPTDAPSRAAAYLQALERSASKQGLAAGDVAALRNAQAELLSGQMGHDVVTMVPKPHPTLVDANEKPLTVLVPETTRALRTDVTATEALESARSSSHWTTKKQWGEAKGVDTEAAKAVEKAQRDAVKEAVPEAAPILKKQGNAIRAADVLDRAEFRQANRDQISLPAWAVAGAEVSQGKIPFLAAVANWVRGPGQMRLGVHAHELSLALERGDTGRVVSILHRLGVGTTAELLQSGAR